MASLILLNGPPGIGKSTLSALFADRHPGTLNLDLDVLLRLVGGWRDDDRTHDVVRPVALAMAAAHLAGGRDVVVPQLLVDSAEIGAFESIALAQGARFREVVLLASRDEALARFDRRNRPGLDDHNRQVVARLGGPAFLGSLYDRLLAVVAARPGCIVVASEPDAIEATYALMLDALG